MSAGDALAGAAGPAPASGGVAAEAAVRAAPGARLPVLESSGPLALRRTRGAPGTAAVTVVGAMSAPVGGDRLRLSATAEPGAALRIGSAAAMVALPGPRGETARYDTRLTAGAGACLEWLPEPLISVRGSVLRMTARVELAAGARLVYREEQILGRAGEGPGALTTRLCVRLDGRPLLDTEFAFGPGAPGWDGPAVLGGRRAAGQLLVVDPAFGAAPPGPSALGETAVLAPLAGPAVLVTALAPEGLELRRLLRAAESALAAGRAPADMLAGDVSG